jgi:hypothetical protein
MIDLQRKFVDYGGRHKLNDLPHVVATVYEPTDLEEVIPKVRSLAESMALSDPAREIFILIDNFDDTAAELEGVQIARELSALVRRFDREGLHCVIVGGTVSTSFELQRRVRNAGYGIGLRTAEAVGALNAARTPAAFRGGAELPVGRGYIVRSGQTTMVQVADPYVGLELSGNGNGHSPNGQRSNGHGNGLVPNGHADDADDDDPEDATAIALDAWVEKLTAKYEGYEPGWTVVVAAEEAEVEAPPSPKALKLGALVNRAKAWEADQVAAKPDLEPLIQTQVDAFEESTWRDEEALLSVLRGIVQRNLAKALGEATAESMVSAMYADDVINQIDRILPKEETSGVVS